MKLFTELKNNDDVWVIYNNNWDKNIPSKFIYAPSDYKLEKCVVNENKLNIPRTYDYSNRYEEYNSFIVHEHWLSITFHDMIYSRYYTNDYNKYKHLTISCEYNYNGPRIEVFPNYEWAKEYLVNICNHEINSIKENIKKERIKINLLKKSLKQVE